MKKRKKREKEEEEKVEEKRSTVPSTQILFCML